MASLCGHLFCNQCTDLLFLNNTTSIECPKCRMNLKREHIHVIYV
jgi:hypothetical protein